MGASCSTGRRTAARAGRRRSCHPRAAAGRNSACQASARPSPRGRPGTPFSSIVRAGASCPLANSSAAFRGRAQTRRRLANLDAAPRLATFEDAGGPSLGFLPARAPRPATSRDPSGRDRAPDRGCHPSCRRLEKSAISAFGDRIPWQAATGHAFRRRPRANSRAKGLSIMVRPLPSHKPRRCRMRKRRRPGVERGRRVLPGVCRAGSRRDSSGLRQVGGREIPVQQLVDQRIRVVAPAGSGNRVNTRAPRPSIVSSGFWPFVNGTSACRLESFTASPSANTPDGFARRPGRGLCANAGTLRGAAAAGRRAAGRGHPSKAQQWRRRLRPRRSLPKTSSGAVSSKPFASASSSGSGAGAGADA